MQAIYKCRYRHKYMYTTDRQEMNPDNKHTQTHKLTQEYKTKLSQILTNTHRHIEEVTARCWGCVAALLRRRSAVLVHRRSAISTALDDPRPKVMIRPPPFLRMRQSAHAALTKSFQN